jgi:transcription elongation factor SPT6
MIDAVNDAGVDLNMACEQEHMRGLLQFVAGLGPRKAAALRTRISQVC